MGEHAATDDVGDPVERWGSVTLSEADALAVLVLGDGLKTVDGKVLDALIDVLARILTYPGPTVAAMSGHAFGMGPCWRSPTMSG